MGLFAKTLPLSSHPVNYMVNSHNVTFNNIKYLVMLFVEKTSNFLLSGTTGQRYGIEASVSIALNNPLNHAAAL
jgi:hypothetical protein